MSSQRDLRSTRRRVISSLALVALFLYGGILWGVLPLQQGVSWQSHLFGFVGGVVAAYVMVGGRPTALALTIPHA